MPYLTVFVAVMFFASNAAASVRACVVSVTAQQHAAVPALDVEGHAHPCSQSDDAAGCLTHCVQYYKSGGQQLAADVPVPVPAPAPAVFHASVRANPTRVVVALAAPVVGPPPTLLFGNFRN
ncbi:MAG: hypothetical protein ACYC7B_00670 [Burkholderiales bacterium]